MELDRIRRRRSRSAVQALARALPLALWALGAAHGAGAAGPEAGGPGRLVLDPDASRVSFVLGATMHSVKGSLRVERGEIGFDPEGGVADGRVVVDARSADTGSGLRDRNMHRDVLESERYPEIVFLPERIAVPRRTDEEADVELSGVIEIHGARAPLTVPASVRREGDHLRIEAEFSVPYVAWGMRDYSNFVLRVAPEVEVSLDLVARLVEPPLTQAP